jgi:hypothetical protein
LFHIVAEGNCWIALRDGAKRYLSAGDVVVMPYADAYASGSDEDAEPVSITTLLPPPPWMEFPQIDYGGRRREHANGVRLPPGRCHAVRSRAPGIAGNVCGAADGPGRGLGDGQLEYAMRATQFSPTGVNQRLPELLFTEVQRIYLSESADRELTGWLAALRDPVVGPALSVLHTRPAQ